MQTTPSDNYNTTETNLVPSNELIACVRKHEHWQHRVSPISSQKVLQPDFHCTILATHQDEEFGTCSGCILYNVI